MQKLLNAHRVPTGVDGAFGRTTHAAVVAFQRKTFPKNPGEWDGVVGRNTRMALMGRAVAPAALSNRRSVPASQVRRRPAAAASSHAAAMPGLPPMKKKMPTWVWIAGAAGAGLLLFLALSPRGRKGARRVAVAGRQAGQGAYNRGRQQVQRLRQRALPPPEAY